jgi:Mg2+/citrate symporter
MRPFRENAFYLLAWRAFLVALITLVLMITRSFELAAAFLIGANVALTMQSPSILQGQSLSVCCKAQRLERYRKAFGPRFNL